MYSISLITLAVGLTFFYRAMHPTVLMARIGVNFANPGDGTTIRSLARRARLALGLAIMVLACTVGKILPNELANGLDVTALRQIDLQKIRTDNRLTSEKRHAAEMIEIFGSADAYLAYLKAQSATKIGL
jgi:hypothetical protein